MTTSMDDMNGDGALITKDPVALHRVELLKTAQVSVELITGNIARTFPATLKISENRHALILVCQGTLLHRKDLEPRWSVVAPRAIAFAPSDSNLKINISRGDHKFYIITWKTSSFQILDSWIQSNIVDPQTKQVKRYFPLCKPMLPDGLAELARVDQLLRSTAPNGLPAVLTLISSSVGLTLIGDSEIGLSPLPSDIPSVIKNLTDKVKRKPDASWPIKDAADLVGYSPFHFSRVFKGIVGYGFHEFVDRCRTEYAVNLLTKTEEPVEIIAATAGFGTAQSLRESVKEHLGLLPSELRLVGDEQVQP